MQRLEPWTVIIHFSQGTPIIQTSLNYRLGPFGFPQGAEAVERDALNLGIKDQRAALQWIQLHIAAFGGDAKKVGEIAPSFFL